jgi:signal transduction histidine kinase
MILMANGGRPRASTKCIIVGDASVYIYSNSTNLDVLFDQLGRFWTTMGVLRVTRGGLRTGAPVGPGPMAMRRILDGVAFILALATFARWGDTEILLQALWVTIAIGAFIYGLRGALLRILIAAIVALGYSAAASGIGQPMVIEAQDLAEWPLMGLTAVIVAVLADRVSTSGRRYAGLYRQASDKLLTAHEEERERLARDLHDGVGQTLTAIMLTLDAAEAELSAGDTTSTSTAQTTIRRAQELAASALQEAREVAAQLRPTRIHEIGLGAALVNLARSAGVTVEVRFDPAILPPGLLEPEPEIDTYRIIQEAIGNAARHSRAASIWIDGHVLDELVSLEVGDDGVGFDESARGRGLGLDGMQERAAILLGGLDVLSEPGEGTRVQLSIPLPVPPQAGGPSVAPLPATDPVR